jgi:peptide-methionine (R)-S-oxide reductase
MNRRQLLVSLTGVGVIACLPRVAPAESAHADPGEGGAGGAAAGGVARADAIRRSPAEWRERLSAEQFRVLFEKGTERAFTSPLAENHADGVYRCAACDLDLFDSRAKFDSGTGWPSFFQPIAPDRVGTESDDSWLYVRTEVHCNRCGGHQGHVFPDGPKPTGLRYCINGVALRFEPRGAKAPI